MENEYSSNQWATYKQWNENNEAVRKDESGHTMGDAVNNLYKIQTLC